jgi:hypothetical protein
MASPHGCPLAVLARWLRRGARENRDEIVILLRNLIKDRTAFVITTRPTYSLPDTLRKQMFEFVVQPFTTEQQTLLAVKWLGERANPFLGCFQQYADGELGGTPLLLTIAVIVYYQAGKLPERRSELYRQFVNDTWQEALKRGAEELGPDLLQDAHALIPLCLTRVALMMTETHGQGSALDFGADVNTLTSSIVALLATNLNLPETVTPATAFEGKTARGNLGWWWLRVRGRHGP